MSVQSAVSLRRKTAERAGRFAGRLSRLMRVGAGESVAGKVAFAVDPTLLRTLGDSLPNGSVVVLGTNGKTSTTAMIARILSADSSRVVTNATGANLVGGVVGALIAGRGGDVGVIEVDEVVAGRVAEAVRPRVIVWTNVFRDQLDRYGEVDLILGYLSAAAEGLAPDGTLVVDADDPGLVAAAERSGKHIT